MCVQARGGPDGNAGFAPSWLGRFGAGLEYFESNRASSVHRAVHRPGWSKGGKPHRIQVVLAVLMVPDAFRLAMAVPGQHRGRVRRAPVAIVHAADLRGQAYHLGFECRRTDERNQKLLGKHGHHGGPCVQARQVVALRPGEADGRRHPIVTRDACRAVGDAIGRERAIERAKR